MKAIRKPLDSNKHSVYPPSTRRSKYGTGSERERSAQALQASEMRYRRLFESAKDGILIVEADSGEIIDVNPFLADLLGYPRSAFLHRHLWDFGPFRDVVATKEAFAKLQTSEYVAYEDLPLETADGRHIDVGFVSNVYLVEGKRVIQCNIRDITQRKLAEKARINLEEQLRASQKMEAIGGLAGGIAHDFNNLLSVVLCYADFVLEGLPAESPLREDLFEIQKASKLAVALTRQLLAFSRKQVLQPVVLDLNRIVEGTERMLRRILGEDVEFIRALAPDLGLTTADAGQIEQVLMNLVVNARDAMPKGGKLTVETDNVELDADYAALHLTVTPGSYVMLAVTDTGCGMTGETQARLFEPFFTTKEPGRGTGLGLSTVYGIVKQSNGNIWVYSEVGHGTTFKIYFPRELSALAATERPAPVDALVKTTGSETILVVEDEEAVRSLGRRILAAAGYRVLTAANGRDALLLCESHHGEISLVLCDVIMPQMSGQIFAAQLQRLRPTTKILFTSGYSDDAVFHQGILEVGVQFIGKPFNAKVLTRKVREMIEEVRTAPTMAPEAP